MAKQSSTRKGEARRVAILQAARKCFAVNGFQATSMQEIMSASGLSAGALYRYYPSKDAIVDAVIRSALAELRVAFDAAIPDKMDSLEQSMVEMIHAVEKQDIASGTSGIALQAWAEAQRNLALAETLKLEMKPLIGWFELLVKSLQKRNRLSTTLPARSVAAALMGILQGFVVERALLGITASQYAKGLRAILGAHAPPV